MVALLPVLLLLGTPASALEPLPPGSCSPRFDRSVLDESLRLGMKYLVTSQLPEGNFVYLRDWQTGERADDDNSVRQAGTLWSLALAYQDRPDPRLGQAVERGLAFYERHSALTSDGKARYVRYPGSREESTGTVALVTLTLIDYLRAPAAGLAATRRAAHGEHLGQYLAFLERLQRPDGLWPDSYDARTGEPGEDSSPYSVGEATLAVVKAARYLGYERLRAAALRAADRGHLRYVVEALAEHPDSPETKGYYQWGSMAFFELATSGWPETQAYARRVIELADWMIDVHRTLERTRNTAYAFEGIIHAYRLAVEAGDRAHAEKFLCTIEQGLTKLTSWQVGGPLANDFIRSRPLRDPEAVGGVQNHCCESPLRIDTTQHQMHALILARRYVFPATAAVQSRQDAP